MSKWQKGKSGNPKGRPKDKEVHSTSVRRLLQDRSEEIVHKAVDLALSGDSVALRLCLERICPPLRAHEEPRALELSANRTLSQQGNDIIAAYASGTITSQHANTVMHCLINQVKLIEFSDLVKKIEELEHKVESVTSSTVVPKIAEEPEYELINLEE